MTKREQMKKANKRAYDREWYLANRSYKKTYNRFNYWSKHSTGAWIARDLIVEDRANQVSHGRWVDERTSDTYVGIRDGRTGIYY